MMTQLVLMRELLGALSGNEMVLGIVLANWLLLTGVGSALGRTAGRLKRPLTLMVVGLILLAVLPIGSVMAVRTLRNVVFARGEMIGVTPAVVGCFVLLAPYCLVSGYLLTLACAALGRNRKEVNQGAASIGQVYALDSAGMVVGGLGFTFVLIHFLSHFGCLYVSAWANLLSAGALALAERRKVLLAGAGVIAGAFAGLTFAIDLDEVSTRIEHEGFRVAFRGNSPYGSLVVTESAGQFNFIENGQMLFSTQNPGAVEETVHYAMAQRPGAWRVLLVGGGVSGTALEILKYRNARVDYVELDPLIIDVGRRFVPGGLADGGIHVIEGDGRSFLRRASERYDVVIADVPEPATSQANRYYTREFFQEVKRAMNDGGVLCVPLAPYENYVSKELACLIGSAHRTLKDVFRNVLIVPGGKLFLLASDGDLAVRTVKRTGVFDGITNREVLEVRSLIADRLEGAGIQPQRLTRGYLDGMITEDRMADVSRPASQEAVANTDFNPVLYYYHLLQWISRFKESFGLLGGALLVVLAAYLVRIRRVELAVFTAGFAASVLEVVLLLGFQVLYGSVYNRLGLIVTMFMAGLGAGSLAAKVTLARRGRRDLAAVVLALAVYAAALPLLLQGAGRLEEAVSSAAAGSAVFSILAFVPGALVGMAFPLAGKVDFQGASLTAGRLYAADLVGASLGAILVSTLLIPLIGVTAVCLVTAGLNVVGGLALLMKRGS